MKVLVIAPHPDDEVLGCGGTIKKYTEKKDKVYLCIVTKTYTPDWTKRFIKNREKEIERAQKILGIKKVFMLNFPAAKIDAVPHKELNKSIRECLEKVNPEIVYIPHWGDMHKDHRMIFESAMVALRPKDKAIRNIRILCYETLSETDWAPPIAGSIFMPNIYINISKTINDKIKAMACYKSELRKFPHPRSHKAIKSLAIKRGVEAGLEMAEAFILIRETLK